MCVNLNLPEKLPESVDNAVKNLTDKPTSNIGTTLGDLWFLVFGGISQAAEKRRIKYSIDLEEFEQACRKKIDQIPETDRTEPDFQQATLALEASKYCVSTETLREMFANLVAGTMNKNTASSIHPIFADTIKQMSEYDAKLFSEFLPERPLPVCQYIGRKPDNTYDIFMPHVLMAKGENPNVDDTNQRNFSLSALEKLGLINISFSTFISNNKSYERYEKCDIYEVLKDLAVKSGNVLEIKRGSLSVTPLGTNLWKICCSPDFDSEKDVLS